jgi:hypothetical protein
VNFYHEFSYVFSLLQKKIPTITIGVLLFSFTACTPIYSPQTVSQPEPSVDPPPPVTQVFFYPNRGQSTAQQDRDKYECYLWATRQTGFDPSRPNLAPHHRVKVIPQPAAGHDTVVGAAAGAVIGAAIGAPSDTAQGAVVGAVAGAMIGAASDSSRIEQAQKSQRQYDEEAAARYADSEKKASNYRRAISACLEGRGYTVR